MQGVKQTLRGIEELPTAIAFLKESGYAKSQSDVSDKLRRREKSHWGLKSVLITSLPFGGGQAGRPVLLAGDGDRGGGVRVVGVLLEGDAEGALTDTRLVRL